MKIVIQNTFLNLMFNIQNKYVNFLIIYHFDLKELKLERLKNIQPTCIIKMNILYTQKI